MEIRSHNNSQPIGKSKLTILVEEESAVRQLWAEHFARNGWHLEVFENPLVFLNQLGRFRNRPEEVYFYFDQDFGRVRGVGTELARAVSRLNSHQVVSLVTRYWPECFEYELASKLIDHVLDKFPPTLFGHSFLDDLIRANSRRYCDLFFGPKESCVLEEALGFDGFHMEFKLEKHFPSRAPKPESKPQTISSPEIPESKRKKPLRTPWWKHFRLIARVNA